MRIIGKTNECYGIHDLQPVSISDVDRPTEMPQLPEGHVLVAIYQRHPNALLPGKRETHALVAICQTFEDVLSLWEDDHKGYVLSLQFGSTDSEVGVYPQPPER